MGVLGGGKKKNAPVLPNSTSCLDLQGQDRATLQATLILNNLLIEGKSPSTILGQFKS